MNKPTEASRERVVNFTELFERAEKDRELVQDLLGIFKQDFPRYHVSLKEAVARKDAKQVEVVAHTMKGMLLNMAARRAADLLGRLEKAARDGDQPSLTEILELFENEVSGLLPELETYLEEVRR
jgi:HPt (histidine-containing phosphotransfer) domain-containing protein